MGRPREYAGVPGGVEALTRKDPATGRRVPTGRYRPRYTVGRRTVRGETFGSERAAWQWLAAQAVDRERGRSGFTRTTSETTGAYVTRWVAHHPTARPSTLKTYRSDLRHITDYPDLAGVDLVKLTPDRVRDWWVALRADLAAAARAAGPGRGATRRDGTTTADRTYRMLRAALNTATGDGLIPANPCTIKGAGSVRQTDRPTLTYAEVLALADEVPARYRALILLLALDAPRKSEAAALTRADVRMPAAPDLATVSIVKAVTSGRGELRIGPPKSAASRRAFTLSPQTTAALRSHLAEYTAPDPGALIFTTSTGGNVYRGIGQIITRALHRIGRDDVTVHDLRGTASTLAAGAGVQLRELMTRLGHADATVALRYLRQAEDADHAAAERIGQLGQAAGGDVVPLGLARRDRTA